MIRTAKRNGADAIVQAGDFGFTFNHNFMRHIRHALEETGLELFFVDGNHDEHPQLFNRWKLDSQGFGVPRYVGKEENRIHYIPRGHRWLWNGKVFMGLGGAVSVDRQYRVQGQSWWSEETITVPQAEYACRHGRVDVLVCHDICASAELPNLRKSSGWPEDVLAASKQHREIIQEVVNATEPKLFVHGHFHTRYQQMVGQMEVVSLDMDGTSPEANLWYVNANLTEYKPPYVGLAREDLFPVSDRLKEIRQSLLLQEIDDKF
jgi:predicted phosphodiesterase